MIDVYIFFNGIHWYSLKKNIGHHQQVLAFLNVHHHHQHSFDNSSEENDRRLDEEVERSLIPQVMFDQMNNKDLFGSIPFTDKQLIVSYN